MEVREVAVYETVQEAKLAGARTHRGDLVTPEGRLVITCAMGARRSDGLRITGFVVTPAAAAHRNWQKIHDVLARCVAKSNQ